MSQFERRIKEVIQEVEAMNFSCEHACNKPIILGILAAFHGYLTEEGTTLEQSDLLAAHGIYITAGARQRYEQSQLDAKANEATPFDSDNLGFNDLYEVTENVADRLTLLKLAKNVCLKKEDWPSAHSLADQVNALTSRLEAVQKLLGKSRRELVAEPLPNPPPITLSSGAKS